MIKSKSLSANVLFAMQAASGDSESMSTILAGKVPEGVDVREWRKTWGEDLRREAKDISDGSNASLFMWAAQQMMHSSMSLLGQLKPVVLGAMVANEDWSDLYIFRQSGHTDSPVIGIWANDSGEARDALSGWITSQCEGKAKGEREMLVNNWSSPETYLICAE